MSESVSDRMREAGKVQTDPALVAIQQLQEGVATSFEVLEADVKKIDERKADTARVNDIAKTVEKLDTQVAAGFKVHADKIDALDRKATAVGIGSFRDIEGCCLAALGPEERLDVHILDHMIPNGKRNIEGRAIFSNPVASALVAHWLRASTLIQKRAFNSRDEETKLYADMERYEKALLDAFRTEKAAALVTTTDTLGGHWLPEPVSAELYRLVLDNSIFGPLASHVPMSTKTLDLPVEGSDALDVDWGTENTNITDSAGASNVINKVTLTASRLQGFALSSLETLQDSAVAILSWIQQKLVEQMGREIDKQILEGTGSPFTGLSGASGVNAATTGANGDAVTFAAVVNTIFRARERASRQGARFYMAPEMAAKIIGLADSQGMPIVQYSSVPGPMASTLLGFPMEVHSVIRADRTYGTGTTLSNLYFGPPSAVVIGDRAGMEWAIDQSVGFRPYQLAMRLVARLAIGIAVPAAFARHENLDV